MKVLITGSYSAIGRALIEHLAPTADDIIMLSRNAKRAEQMIAELKQIHRFTNFFFYPLDLTSPKQIKDVAEQVNQNHGEINLLINNAGYSGTKSTKLDHEVEQHFQVNTLAPLQLMSTLTLSADATVVHLGSSAMNMVRRLHWNPEWHQHNFKKMSGAYAHSKLALAVLNQHLSELPQYDGRRLLTVDPGPTQSAMSRSDSMPVWVRIVQRWFQSPEKAALRILDSVMDTSVVTGSYVQGGRARPVAVPAVQVDLYDWWHSQAASWG